MKTHSSLFAVALLAAAWLCAAPAVAADDAASFSTAQPVPGVPWAQLTPEQQTVLEPYRERWNQLPPDRQQAFARGADRWQQMTPEQRQKMQERWRHAPPEQREKMRKHMQERQGRGAT